MIARFIYISLKNVVLCTIMLFSFLYNCCVCHNFTLKWITANFCQLLTCGEYQFSVVFEFIWCHHMSDVFPMHKSFVFENSKLMLNLFVYISVFQTSSFSSIIYAIRNHFRQCHLSNVIWSIHNKTLPRWWILIRCQNRQSFNSSAAINYYLNPSLSMVKDSLLHCNLFRRQLKKFKVHRHTYNNIQFSEVLLDLSFL